MSEKKTYEQGMIDAVKIYGEACGGKVNCSECGVGVVIGADVSCHEFAQKFPQKFITLLKESLNNGVSYAEVYAMRFPNSSLSAEDLANLGMCRKVIFDGDLTCNKDSTECLNCWKSIYMNEEDTNEDT